MTKRIALIPAERIERAILLIRGHKVILDSDLAALYGVEPKVLLQAFRRNIKRFPADFAFQLTAEEFAVLRSQIVTSNADRRRAAARRAADCGHRRADRPPGLRTLRP